MGKNIKYIEDIVTFPSTMGNSLSLYSDVYDIPGNNGEVLLDAQAVNSEKITASFNIGVENVSTGVSGGEFNGVVSASIIQLTTNNTFTVKLYGIGWTSPNTGRNDLADADAITITVSAAANTANKDIDLLCIALNNMLRATTYITTGEYAGSVLTDFIEFYKTGDLKIACRTLKTGRDTGVTLADVTGTPVADLGMTVGTQIGASYEYSTLSTDGTIASNVVAASVTGTTAPLMAGTVSIGAATPGFTATSGYQEITNTGNLGTFTGATVPGITSATYDLDITIDGGALRQTATALLNTDDWDGIAAKIQTALRTATTGTETVVVTGGVIRVTSADTTGVTSIVLLAAGTAGSGGGDLLTAITALSADYTATIIAAVDGIDGVYANLSINLGASKADAATTNLVAATTYTATITDNLTGAMAISILGSAATTVANLVTEINTDLTGVTATHVNPSQYIVITHDTIGAPQTVACTDTTLLTTLFHEVIVGDNFEISFTGDGWPITILDYHVTTNPTGIGPFTFTISAAAAADTVVADLVAQLEADWIVAGIVKDKDSTNNLTLGTYLQWTVSGGKVKFATKSGYQGTDNSFTLTDGGTALNTGLVIADATYIGTGGTDTSLIALNNSTITIGDAVRVKVVTNASGALATGHGITVDAAFVGPEMQPVEGARSVKSYTNLLNNGITFLAGSYIVSDAVETGNYNSKVITNVSFSDLSKISSTVKVKLQTTFGVKQETTITEDSDYIITSYTTTGATWYDITDTPTTLTTGTGTAIYTHSETTKIARFVRAKIYAYDGTGAIAADSGIDLTIELQG